MERGDTRRFLELWVERGIRELKRRTKFRSTSDPEKVIVNGIELGKKLHLLQQHKHIRSLASLLSGDGDTGDGDSSSSNMSSSKKDSKRLADEDGSFLLDTGVLLQGDERQGAADVVAVEFCKEGENVSLWGGWTEEDVRSASVYAHPRASLEDEEILFSKMYGLAKKKDSTHVSVKYEIGGVDQYHVGSVAKFLRFVPCVEGGSGLRPLRVALIDFYTYVDPVLNDDGEVDQDWGLVHKVPLNAEGKPPVQSTSFPCKIGDIGGKLVYCEGVAGIGPHKGRQVRYLKAYNHLSAQI